MDTGQRAQAAIYDCGSLQLPRAFGMENACAFQPFDFSFKPNLLEIRLPTQAFADDSFVFFRFQRTSGVEQAATGLDGLHDGLQDFHLPLLLPLEFGFGETVANLWIAGQRAGSAARSIA